MYSFAPIIAQRHLERRVKGGRSRRATQHVERHAVHQPIEQIKLPSSQSGIMRHQNLIHDARDDFPVIFQTGQAVRLARLAALDKANGAKGNARVLPPVFLAAVWSAVRDELTHRLVAGGFGSFPTRRLARRPSAFRLDGFPISPAQDGFVAVHHRHVVAQRAHPLRDVRALARAAFRREREAAARIRDDRRMEQERVVVQHVRANLAVERKRLAIRGRERALIAILRHNLLWCRRYRKIAFIR